ncbi:MAG: hypothetical protein HC912_01090 [Saprospiraceae bacterium]|nr:hypothetical protein [Saprospiraceae bacterium]
MTTFGRILVFSVLVVACGSPAVQQDNPYASSLLRKRDSLDELQTVLKIQLDSMWNYANGKLAEMLPANMPDQERTNMLALRNAPLIRMFEVYATLPESIHKLIDSAYYFDKRVVQQLEGIVGERAENETKIEDFLIELSNDKQVQSTFDYWNKQFNATDEVQK